MPSVPSNPSAPLKAPLSAAALRSAAACSAAWAASLAAMAASVAMLPAFSYAWIASTNRVKPSSESVSPTSTGSTRIWKVRVEMHSPLSLTMTCASTVPSWLAMAAG